VKTVYLLIGVPGSGKSWVADKVKSRCTYIANDDYIGKDYIGNVCRKISEEEGPFLVEATFSISRIKEPLENAGHKVIPIFIIEHPQTLTNRWDERGTTQGARGGHLTRQETYKFRANAWNAFSGNSSEVLNYIEDEL
jgi:hypothetical protein